MKSSIDRIHEERGLGGEEPHAHVDSGFVLAGELSFDPRSCLTSIPPYPSPPDPLSPKIRSAIDLNGGDNSSEFLGRGGERFC